MQKNEVKDARGEKQRVGLARRGRVTLVDDLTLNDLAASKRLYRQQLNIMRSQKLFFGL